MICCRFITRLYERNHLLIFLMKNPDVMYVKFLPALLINYFCYLGEAQLYGIGPCKQCCPNQMALFKRYTLSIFACTSDEQLAVSPPHHLRMHSTFLGKCIRFHHQGIIIQLYCYSRSSDSPSNAFLAMRKSTTFIIIRWYCCLLMICRLGVHYFACCLSVIISFHCCMQSSIGY